MRYFVTADTHGYYHLLEKALRDAGFFDCQVPHKLVLLGDCMDRGSEALAMQAFLLKLFEEDRLILIRGNHEDLWCDMIEDFYDIRHDMMYGMSHHARNGTFDTALQLTGLRKTEAITRCGAFLYLAKQTPYHKTLIPHAIDYLETEHHLFTHGYLPSEEIAGRWHLKRNWREADEAAWRRARWINGMEAVLRPENRLADKTVVCGHYHTSYGHAKLEGICTEFGEDALFTPYEGNGVLALDACTYRSGFVNCVVIDDEPK